MAWCGHNNTSSCGLMQQLYFLQNRNIGECFCVVIYSVLFNFGHIRRWDQYGVYIFYLKISTDPGLLKIRHSHRFVAMVIEFFILISYAFWKLMTLQCT